MYVMGKASKMPRQQDSLIGGKDHKENYLQLKVWEVEEETVRSGYRLWSAVFKTRESSGGCLPCGCSRLLGGEGGGRHLYSVTGSMKILVPSCIVGKHRKNQGAKRQSKRALAGG